MTGLGTISPKVLNVQVAAFFSFRDNELRMFRFYVGKWKKIPRRVVCVEEPLYFPISNHI